MIIHYSRVAFNKPQVWTRAPSTLTDLRSRLFFFFFFSHLENGFTRNSFVEHNWCRFNLWQRGHTGTLMANHTITWGEQIRHEHAHTQTYILLLSNVAPQRRQTFYKPGTWFYFFCQCGDHYRKIESGSHHVYYLTTIIHTYTSLNWVKLRLCPISLTLSVSDESVFKHAYTHTHTVYTLIHVSHHGNWLDCVTTDKHLRYFFFSFSSTKNLVFWGFFGRTTLEL